MHSILYGGYSALFGFRQLLGVLVVSLRDKEGLLYTDAAVGWSVMLFRCHLQDCIHWVTGLNIKKREILE